MSAENVAIVRGIYNAFAAGDVAGVLGAMSPDLVWHEAENFPYADRNPYNGPQAVHVWTLEHGKVTGFQQYIDTLDVARATGAA